MTVTPTLRVIPPRAFDPTPAAGASRWDIMRGRLREMVHRVLDRIGCPGVIRPMVVRDTLTGNEIEITLSHTYSVISINGRDFYFDRLTGRFGGTGSGCRQPMR